MIIPNHGWNWLGTAFLVGYQGTKEGLLMTAAHVLREANTYGLPQRHPSALSSILQPPMPAINRQAPKLYVGIHSKGGYQLADVVDFWYHEHIDIGMACAVIRPESDVTFVGKLAIDMSPPIIGTSVMAVGFPKMTVENGDQDPNTGLFRVTAGTLLERRSGTVTELCLPDTTMYRGPGFLVDCPFGAGMSGGPVLEVRPGGDVMTVRGLITGDLTDQSEEQGRGSGLRAFASMLTPALIMKTRVGIDGVEGAVKVIDLVRHGFIDERGGALEHVQIVELPDGQFTLRWAREW